MQVNNLASSVVGFKSKEKSGSFFLSMLHLLSCLNWTNQPFDRMYKMLCKMLCIFICCTVLHQFYVLGFEHELAKNFSFETLLVVVSNGTSSIELWPTYGQLLQCHKSPRHFTPVLKKFYVSWLQPMRSKFFHISDIVDTTWRRSRLLHHREPKKNHRGDTTESCQDTLHSNGLLLSGLPSGRVYPWDSLMMRSMRGERSLKIIFVSSVGTPVA